MQVELFHSFPLLFYFPVQWWVGTKQPEKKWKTRRIKYKLNFNKSQQISRRQTEDPAKETFLNTFLLCWVGGTLKMKLLFAKKF